MVRALLIRGMLAGALAGLLASAFAWIFGEPQVDVAIGFEQHLRAIAGATPEPELVSRAVQSTAGLLIGIVIYGSALGGIFSLVFAYLYGRLGRLSARATAAILAAVGFGALILIPQIKYPARPPSIGAPETIAIRTALYFTMIAWSVIAALAAASIVRQLVRRHDPWHSAVIGASAYLAIVAAVGLLLPSVNEVPADFPASTLWNFRLVSLGIEAVLWTALGLIFGVLAERQLALPGGRTAARGNPRRLVP